MLRREAKAGSRVSRSITPPGCILVYGGGRKAGGNSGPSGAVSLNRGAGFALGAEGCGVWREGAGARAVTLLGGARVGYLRAAVVAAPVAFEEEAPIVCVYMYV